MSGRKMKLGVLDRLIAFQLLPAKGNITNLELIRVAKETLSLSEKEKKVLNMRQEMVGGESQWRWDPKYPEQTILLGETPIQLIRAEFRRLNDTEELPDEYVATYHKFMKE